MSKKGIKIFSNILFAMQNCRIELLKGDKIDFRLAQMLEEMKESVKDKFNKITIKY